MSPEMWQFVIAAGVGATVALLWILLVYRPRRTGEGQRGDGEKTRSDEPSEPKDRE